MIFINININIIFLQIYLLVYFLTLQRVVFIDACLILTNLYSKYIGAVCLNTAKHWKSTANHSKSLQITTKSRKYGGGSTEKIRASL